MTSIARCRLCSETISFTKGNPVELGLHMMKEHNTNTTVLQYQVEEVPSICNNRKSIVQPKCSISARSVIGPAHFTSKKRRIRRGAGAYKNTLESCALSGCRIHCPTCKKEVNPLMRRQRRKVAYNSFGASCLLTCWPFCFLLGPLQKNECDLYCPFCKRRLGAYDSVKAIYKTAPNVPLIMTENVPKVKVSNMTKRKLEPGNMCYNK